MATGQSVASVSAGTDRSQADLLTRRVTIHLEGVSVRRAVDAIAVQAGIHAAYRASIFAAVKKTVTISVTNASLRDVLRDVLSGTELNAKPVADDIVRIDVGTDAMGGIIVGRVTDAATQLPLRDVTIVLDNASKGIPTASDGTFRLTGIKAGQHRVLARMLGHVKQVRTITIADGDSVAVNFALSQSTTALDQIVVTGTVIPTAIKAIPNAITVITAKELEDRNITRIDQLFHGDVPGVFVPRVDEAASSDPGYSRSVSARGSTSFYTGNESIKTYIDGIEVVDPHYLGLIDPHSIERIEILTGPQASTIYGSNAMNGVIQIFTKRGKTSRPQLVASLQSSFTQNNFSSSLAPSHLGDLSLSAVDGRVSYNVGATGQYAGSWTPSVRGTNASGYGGITLNQGPFVADFSYRLIQGQNKSNGRGRQARIEYTASGLGNEIGGAFPDRQITTNTGRSSSISLSYKPLTWWSHGVTIGYDDLTGMNEVNIRRFQGPYDSAYFINDNARHGVTVTYNTSLQVPMSSVALAVVTVGVDGSTHRNEATAGNYLIPDFRPGHAHRPQSTDPGGFYFNQEVIREHGGYLNSQLGLFDQFFITYGVRAVYNPNVGADQNPNLEPRYGLAYTMSLGIVTAKARVSYGTATRPPGAGKKAEQGGPFDDSYDAFRRSIYGTSITQIANPDLLPEKQNGGEGGLDLYLGTIGSLTITRHNQVVNDLIVAPTVDSVDLLPAFRAQYNIRPWQYPLRQIQNVNIGSVRNQGWEMTGNITMGHFETHGTYSWDESRIIGVTERYRRQFPQYVKGASFMTIPEHTWSLGVNYTTTNTRVGFDIQGHGILQTVGWDLPLGFALAYDRLDINKPRMDSPAVAWGVLPGYPMVELNVTQRLSSHIDGILSMTNVANTYQSDALQQDQAQPGRATNLGIRVRF